MLAVATLSFDMAVPDIFLPLIEGGHIVVADRDTVLDPHRLAALIDESGCTLIQATPAIWRSLAEAGWTGGPGFKLVAGGEVLVRELAERLTAARRPHVERLWPDRDDGLHNDAPGHAGGRSGADRAPDRRTSKSTSSIRPAIRCRSAFPAKSISAGPG